MDVIARFGRAFFTALYDLRLPVAVGSILVVVGLLVVVWRRGWFATARRHPMASGAVLAVALAVGLPTTWYLASPIWIRTSLVEAVPTPPPADVAQPTPAPSVAQVAPTAPPTSSPTIGPDPTPTSTPFTPSTVARGSFRGTDDFHFGSGTATLLEVSPGRYHLRLDAFSVRNGPDLYVYLSTSRDGYADDALELGKLKATDGSFGYELAPGIDPVAFRSAIIWCKQFSHLFAVAVFEA